MPEPIKIEVGSMAPPGSPKLVGRRIAGLSQGQALGMLKGEEVSDKVVQKAVEGSERNHPEEAGHVPCIGALTTVQDGWGVFCMRCSSDAKQYIYPCKINPEDWPPEILVPYVEADRTTVEVTPE